MSSFYGQVFGASKTPATRRGYQDIEVSAQSWNGSVQTRLYYDGDDLKIDVHVSEGSSASGSLLFSGTLDEYKRKLRR